MISEVGVNAGFPGSPAFAEDDVGRHVEDDVERHAEDDELLDEDNALLLMTTRQNLAKTPPSG